MNHDPAFDGLADGDDEDDDEPELSSDELDDESAWHRNFSSRTAALVSAASRSPFSRSAPFHMALKVAGCQDVLLLNLLLQLARRLLVVNQPALEVHQASLQLFLGAAAAFQLFFKLLCLLLLCPQL